MQQNKTTKLAGRIILALIIAAGIALRLFIYLQNRNLIIDEANVARNVFERGYTALLQPLDYAQYAPPLFLWIVKSCSVLLGFSEFSLKLFPLLTGIASLFLFNKFLKKILPWRITWYPLLMLSAGYMFLRYSTELKQYMPDVFVTISLLLLAVSTDVRKQSALSFIGQYIVAGSMAILLSMPSVFILTGVCLYLLAICVQSRQYKKILLIAVPAVVWAAQFLLYYIFILQPQASSPYLQNFHAPYFLTADLQHNLSLLQGLLSVAGGHTAIAIYTHLALLLISVVALFRKNIPLLVLLFTPLCLLICAAALHQFSLLDRVSLFIMPVILTLIGYGLYSLIETLRHIITRVVIYALTVIIAISFCGITAGYPYKYEELTGGLEYTMKNNVHENNLYLYHSSVPAFVYYTHIHPQKNKWEGIKNANKLEWFTNYDSLGAGIKSTHAPSAFIYTNVSNAEIAARTGMIDRHLILTGKLDERYVKAYIYKSQ